MDGELVQCDHAAMCSNTACDHHAPHVARNHVGVGWDGEEYTFSSCTEDEDDFCGSVMAAVRCVKLGSDW